MMDIVTLARTGHRRHEDGRGRDMKARKGIGRKVCGNFFKIYE
jgi:hypothetical protein